MLTKILGLAIPLPSLRGKKGLSFRWVYIKEVLSFLRKWRVKKAEVAVSFSDPMANGLLYGLISALEDGKRDRKIQIDINFLGKNRFSGEAIISPGVFFQHLKRWILLLLREKKGRGQKGGE
ncbi:MAG: hypothetical protein HXY46_15675 [Syntrophaceae bacterium]|nr:hypothetical protein [Syntrophaceae bacterium]